MGKLQKDPNNRKCELFFPFQNLSTKTDSVYCRIFFFCASSNFFNCHLKMNKYWIMGYEYSYKL